MPGTGIRRPPCKRPPIASTPQSEADREFHWLKTEVVANVSFLE
ncbi:hypothetical protein C7S13_7655 [Burkholderia cepacia]|nr:hypothetical protein [Burkholderia cepacia]